MLAPRKAGVRKYEEKSYQGIEYVSINVRTWVKNSVSVYNPNCVQLCTTVYKNSVSVYNPNCVQGKGDN